MKNFVIQHRGNPKFNLCNSWQNGPTYKRLDRALARFPSVSPFYEYRLLDIQNAKILKTQNYL
jgi:hypothetical protein